MSNKVCTRCVMDTTDTEIYFDSNGICNHCIDYDHYYRNWLAEEHLRKNSLEKLFTKIKTSSKIGKYDSIIGLSGGVDSSYIALLAKRYGLNPLCVHLDNGWNSELATDNIHKIVQTCNFDLYTHVIEWDEFRELQRAFFMANVIDLELLSDHAIFGVILSLAKKHNIKFILSGANFSTEFIMPKSWVHRKQDLRNIRDICNKFSDVKIKSFPQVSTFSHAFSMFILGYKVIKPLNLIEFNKESAKLELKEKLGWRDYGGKHYESIFTKFYQAYILPTKFNIDKRKPHLSTLINSNQISREEAFLKLEEPLYNPRDLENDTDFVLKKLGFTKEWFKQYQKTPATPHLNYKSDQFIYNILLKIKNFLNASI